MKWLIFRVIVIVPLQIVFLFYRLRVSFTFYSIGSQVLCYAFTYNLNIKNETNISGWNVDIFLKATMWFYTAGPFSPECFLQICQRPRITPTRRLHYPQLVSPHVPWAFCIFHIFGPLPCTHVASNVLAIDVRSDIRIACDGLQQKFQHARYS